MLTMTTDTFDHFWKLGYHRLVPIVPPDAVISELSSMAKRKDARGKAVGVRGRDGKWFGFDWLPHESNEDDIARWQAMGAGTGIKTGQGLVAIDADTLNEDHARIIRDTVEKHFGPIPARVGRYPKVLYPLRVSEPLKYTRIEFGQLNDKNQLESRVEILSDGRQFVAAGTHPTTGNPYHWPRELVPFDDLPCFPAASVLHMLEELRTLLPAATKLTHEGADTNVDQASLKGDVALVRKAVEATPNTSAAFGTREAYRDFGYAIKAALPDNEGEAFDIYAAWCERWTDGENDPDVVEADWRRMKPPFRRGANWLYELAEQHAPQSFSRAEVFFSPIEDSTNPFDTAIDKDKPETAEPLLDIKWVNPREWHGVTPPERKWIVPGMVPDGEVTLLTGAGGVGKTLAAQQLGTCISKALPFLGIPTLDPTPGADPSGRKVMLFLCEDSEDELHMRQRDINASLCLDMNDVSANLRIASRKYMDNLLTIWDRNTGAMKRSAVWKQLSTDAKAFGAKVIVVDTIADTFGGNEIDRSQVRQFVQSCLGRLAQEIGGAVIALGHPSKAGQTSGEGTSGSTAWHASVRSRLYLEHVTKDASGPFRKLSNKKANYGPAGDVFMLRWSRGAFELVTSKTSAIIGADGVIGGAAGLGGTRNMAETIDDAIILGVAEMAAQGVQMSMVKNGGYFAPKVLRERCDALAIFDVKDVEAGMERALAAHRVEVAIVGRKPNRHPILGYRVNVAAINVETADEGVFD